MHCVPHKIKSSLPVSRILSGSVICKRLLNRFPSFILPRHYCRGHTTYPPATDEQSLKPVYMVFQPIRCTATDVTTNTGKLLPHLFTRSRDTSAVDGYFLLHYYTLTDIFLLESMALFVVRTFLSPPTGEERWNGKLRYKVNKTCSDWTQNDNWLILCLKNMKVFCGKIIRYDIMSIR